MIEHWESKQRQINEQGMCKTEAVLQEAESGCVTDGLITLKHKFDMRPSSWAIGRKDPRLRRKSVELKDSM